MRNYPLIIKNIIRSQYRKILYGLLSIGYDENFFYNKQKSTLKALGINLKSAELRLESYINEYKIKKYPSSWHWLFAAGLSENKKIKNILEIGTHRGEFTHFLADVFPHSKITTIELPDDNPIFLSSYSRTKGSKLEKQLKARNKLLRSKSNIKFIQKNSINLTFFNEKYDFIWVDGAHGYPVVSIDIANSIRLINSGGFIAFDDVRVNNVFHESSLYSSNGSWDTLKEFINDGSIDVTLLNKRTKSPRSHKLINKYIAVAKLNN